MIRINEVFGPTIQGEGPNTGRHCLFIRVSRCNLHCSWCDTPYTWAHTASKASHHHSGHIYDPSVEEQLLSTEDVLNKLRDLWMIDTEPTMIVISGGEPMLQQKELAELIEILLVMGHDVEIETAGTIAPIFAATHIPGTEHPVVLPYGRPEVHFEVSPKLHHSGNEIRAMRNWQALNKLATLNSDFKFVVVNGERDVAEVEFIVNEIDLPGHRVWLMPEGTTVDTIKQHGLDTVKFAMDRGWNFSLRNQIWLWGDKRGF